MSEIVNFPAKENRIWVCNCGCATFIFYEDGSTKCAVCDLHTHDGNWFTEKPDGPEREEEPFKDISGNGSIEFARRYIQKRATEKDVKMIAVADCDGVTTFWADFETQEQAEWVRRKISIATKLFEEQVASHFGSEDDDLI